MKYIKSFNELNENSEKSFSKAAEKFKSYYTGWDEDVEIEDGKYGAHVFEFPNEEKMNSFIDEVGGMPHPLGGLRTVLTESFNEAYDDYDTPMWHKHRELKLQLIELKNDLKDAWLDMENDPEVEPEGGPVANKWADRIEKMEKEIAEVESKINKMENTVKKARTPQSDAQKKITKNVEEIRKSILSWPDRTPEQQAEIYKKRYSINDDLETIVNVLKELKLAK
jgi:hypothetical protein